MEIKVQYIDGCIPEATCSLADGLPILSNRAFNHLIDGEQNFVKILHSEGFSLLARTLDSALSAAYKI